MSSPSSKPISKIFELLKNSSSRTDVVLANLATLTTSTTHTSALLQTIQYTTNLLHAALLHALTRRYEALAISIATQASKTMLPGEILEATIEAPHLTLTSHCTAAASFLSTVAETRQFLRLGGLLHLYARGKELYGAGSRDPAVKILNWVKLATLTAFQGTENLAFLTRKGVVTGQKWVEREASLWRWSWRFWGLGLGVDLVRLLRVRQLRFREELGAQGKEADVVEVRSKELERRWKRELFATLAWVPATLHWSSLDNEDMSPVSETWVGISGLVPGLIALQDAWKKTA